LPDPAPVSPWMGDVDPSQIGFPFAVDKTRFTKEPGLVYKETESGPLQLDAYRPVGVEGPAPLVVMIHGGGWHQGGRYQMGLTRWAGYLASAGLAVVSIDYRLAPESHFPEPFADCLDAIDWAVEHAPRLGADPERIGLWGDSAGGHLVLLAGTSQTRADFDGPRLRSDPAALRSMVAWYPPTDLLDLHQRAGGEALGHSVVQNFVGATPEEDAARWQSVSPIAQAHANAPPTLILQGTRDLLVPHDQATRYAERLEALGAPHELHIVEDAVHGFDRVAPGAQAKALIERSRDFLCETLRA
jgi:acetyl esterase/lipase